MSSIDLHTHYSYQVSVVFRHLLSFLNIIYLIYIIFNYIVIIVCSDSFFLLLRFYEVDLRIAPNYCHVWH
jgi:hypothetical protein